MYLLVLHVVTLLDVPSSGYLDMRVHYMLALLHYSNTCRKPSYQVPAATCRILVYYMYVYLDIRRLDLDVASYAHRSY